MNDEKTFLCGLLTRPEDTATRMAYADWLEGRGDARARFLRMDPSLERINYVDWLEKDGQLDYYLKNFPEIRREAEKQKSTESMRNQRRLLSSTLDCDWVAFMNSLGCPFEPFFSSTTMAISANYRPKNCLSCGKSALGGR